MLIETEVKQEEMDGHSLDGEHSGVASKAVPSLICVSPYHWDLRPFKTGCLP